MRKIAGYLTKNRSEKDQKTAQSTHENEYIKPRKTFWRNSKQLLKFSLRLYVMNICISPLHGMFADIQFIFYQVHQLL
ncbi:hypothetical protein B5F25_19180 [Bacteroides sp. An19]|nr:hypothetical protein B5F25_19180 [Bacteroides sp. An19]